MNTFGTYRVSKHGPTADFVTITFYGSDADTARKGWRSIGCHSVARSQLNIEVEAIERTGRKLETRERLVP